MISLIIPVFNEVENIQPLVVKIKKSLKKYRYEVIFINDGSYDGTEMTLKKVINENKKFSCLTFKRNYGQTAALQAGFDYSSGEIVVAMDGDLQNDPADIPKLLKKMEEGYDVVSGWRKNRKDNNLLRVIPSTTSVSVETSPGITSDSAGTKSTSSNVKPSTIFILSTYPFN